MCVRHGQGIVEQTMIIPLDDGLRIRGTERCWQLEKLKSVKGQDEWRPFKYFTTMDNALREAAQRELRLFPANGVSEAIAACEAVTAKYAKIFDEVGTTVPRKGALRGLNAEIKRSAV